MASGNALNVTGDAGLNLTAAGGNVAVDATVAAVTISSVVTSNWTLTGSAAGDQTLSFIA